MANWPAFAPATSTRISGTVFVGQIEERQGPARRPDRRRAALFRNADGGPSWRCLDAHPRGGQPWGASINFAQWLKPARPRKHHTGGWVSYFAAHRGVPLGHERRSAERRRAQSRPCRHADDRAALRASCAVVSRRDDSQIRADVRDGG